MKRKRGASPAHRVHGEEGRVIEPVAVAPFDYSVVISEIADKLKAQAERIRARIRKFTEDIIEIGRDLLAAKDHLDHGQFGEWVERELKIPRRSAQAYMAAARLHEKSATVALLPPATVYRLAAPSVPPAVLEIVVTKAEAGEIVPDTAVKKMICEAKLLASKERRETERREAEAKLSKRARQKRAGREAEALKWKQEEAELEEADRRVIDALIAKIGIDAARAVHAALIEGNRGYHRCKALEAALAIINTEVPNEPTSVPSRNSPPPPDDDPLRIPDFLDRRKSKGAPSIPTTPASVERSAAPPVHTRTPPAGRRERADALAEAMLAEQLGLSPHQPAMPEHAELETFCSKIGCLCSKYALSPPCQLRALAAGWAADGISLEHCLGTIEGYLMAHAANCRSGSSDRLFRWVDIFLRRPASSSRRTQANIGTIKRTKSVREED